MLLRGEDSSSRRISGIFSAAAATSSSSSSTPSRARFSAAPAPRAETRLLGVVTDAVVVAVSTDESRDRDAQEAETGTGAGQQLLFAMREPMRLAVGRRPGFGHMPAQVDAVLAEADATEAASLSIALATDSHTEGERASLTLRESHEPVPLFPFASSAFSPLSYAPIDTELERKTSLSKSAL